MEKATSNKIKKKLKKKKKRELKYQQLSLKYYMSSRDMHNKLSWKS